MKRHTRLYMISMGYDPGDWIQCECYGCESAVVDVHHIEARGMGGSNSKDYHENLMGLCRHHHEKYGDRKDAVSYLKACHRSRMIERGVKYDSNLIKIEHD